MLTVVWCKLCVACLGIIVVCFWLCVVSCLLLFVDSGVDPCCWLLVGLLLVVVCYVLLVVRCELRVVCLFSGIVVSLLYDACRLLLIVVF